VDDEPLPGGTSAQPDGGVEVRALPQSERGRKHGSSGFRATSGRQALTALSATSGKNRTAGPGAHAQPETVGLRTAAVVRLERALAHSGAPRKESVQQVNGPERCTNREMGSSRSQFHQVRGIPYGTGRRATRSNRTLRRAPVEAPALSRFSPRVSMHVDNALNHSRHAVSVPPAGPIRRHSPRGPQRLRKETSGVGEARPCCVHRLWTMVWTNDLLTSPNTRI